MQFQLAASVDTSSLGRAFPIIKQMFPFSACPLLKPAYPMILSAKKGELPAHIRMGEQEFVPGDTISLALHVDNTSGGWKKRSMTASQQNVTVHLKLVQIHSAIAVDDVADQVKPAATTTRKLSLVKPADGEEYSYYDADLTLQLLLISHPLMSTVNSFKPHTNCKLLWNKRDPWEEFGTILSA